MADFTGAIVPPPKSERNFRPWARKPSMAAAKREDAPELAVQSQFETQRKLLKDHPERLQLLNQLAQKLGKPSENPAVPAAPEGPNSRKEGN